MERKARLQSFLYISWIHRALVERYALFTELSFHYLSQFPLNGHPPHGARWYADRERHPSTEPTSHPLKIHLSLRVPGKGAPFMFPNRVLMERDTLSPEPLVYLLISVCQSPQKGALLQSGDKHKVTIHGTPRGRKVYIQWGAAWFPKGIVNDTAITSPVPCNPWHDTFHLGLGRPEPRYPARVVATLNKVYPPHLLPLPM